MNYNPFKRMTNINIWVLLFIVIIPLGGLIWFAYDVYKANREKKK